MKKLFTLIAATILCVGAQAQSVNIHLKNGTSIYYSGDSVQYVDFNETLEVPSTNINFVKIGNYSWADRNIGASQIWEPGLYFCFCEKKGTSLDDVAADNYALPFDDVTYKTRNIESNPSNWKPNGYKVPGVTEFNNLIDNSNIYWGRADDPTWGDSTDSSMSGLWFVSKADASKRIFIPAVGLMHEEVYATSEHYNGEEGHGGGHFGCYWTKDSKDKDYGCGFFFGCEDPVFEKKINVNEITNRIENTEYKWYALPIRPIQ